MLKSSLPLSILIALVFSSCGHKGKMAAHEWAVYASAMDHGDLLTSINSLNRIVAFDKYDADALDTLAILYLRTGSNEPAAKIAFRALNVRKSDAVTEVAARANKNLSNFEIALEYFEELQKKQPDNLELLYEVAYANINLNRLKDALPAIDQLIHHKDSESEVMQEYFKGGSQLVPYSAIAYNMKGFVQTQTGKSDKAVESYEKALQIFPKYYLADNNLKVLRAQLRSK